MDSHRVNQRWSLEFGAGGRRFRVLVVVDDFTGSAWRWSARRESPVQGQRRVESGLPRH